MAAPKIHGESELGRLEFGPEDLRRVREVVQCIADARLPDRASDVVLAVHELAVNSILHGGGHGVLHVDEVGGALVFTVEDADGTGSVPEVREPDDESTSGRGLWIAQRLSDHMTIDTRPASTRVRLHLALVAS